MKLLKRRIYTLLLTLFYLISINITIVNAFTTEDINIVVDSDSTTKLPSNFRKTTNLGTITKLSSLNLKGLDTLNISGSGQFTLSNLPLLMEEIDTSLKIIDIDLREESHGFVNNIAISFKNDDNSANKGLTLKEVILKENEDLASIKLDTPLSFYNKPKLVVEPKSIVNELTGTKENGIGYLRIPVTDGGLPNEEMVRYFVDFVNKQPENTWLHFHCKAGVGRTTTFMIMYDIMKNHDKASLNDIIGRQVLLSDISPKDKIDFFIGKRYEFLKDFYSTFNNSKSKTNKKVEQNNIAPPFTLIYIF